MRKFLFVLTAVSNFVFVQQKSPKGLWHLTIVNNTTAKGIAGATISINSKRYFITDVSGVADIDKNIVDQHDSIRISSIGYQTKWLRRAGVDKLPDTIRLAESITGLDEVKIDPLKSPTITLSGLKTRYGAHFQPGPNREFAQYMPNDKKITGTIISVGFELNDDVHGIEMPFNIEILSRSKDSIFPDTALFTDSIIVRNPEKKKRLSVDISHYHIQVPENGFFVVFQTLPRSYYKNNSIWYDGRYHIRIPGINVFLKQKNYFEGECCDVDPPASTGFYCLLGCDRNDLLSYEKRDQWIVYAQGINFAISAIVSR